MLVLAASLMTGALGAERSVVDISLGWRHHLGPYTEHGSCPDPEAAFPTKNMDRECVGLGYLPGGNAAPAACAAACCPDPSCLVWQWSKTDTKPCWGGQPTGPCQPGNGSFAGAARTGPPGSDVPVPARVAFDDGGWAKVDTPHDFVIDGAYSPNVSNSQAGLPKNVSWYRKHLGLPAAWEGTHIDLYVEGAYSVATYYLNGQLLGRHATGYTSAIFRLDNATAPGLRFGLGAENILAIFVDATEAACTGWWYEGGGLFRNTYLISTDPIHVVPHGLFAPAYFTGGFRPRATPALGMTAATAHLRPSATIVVGTNAAAGSVTLVFSLYPLGGAAAIGTVEIKAGALAAGVPTTVSASELVVNDTELWTVPRPQLHTLSCSVSTGGKIVDVMNETVGLRSSHWDPALGFVLNEQRVKMRGFCNHESFAGVGMAVADRINLFRLQSMRGLGGNAIRASHNPPNPAMLKLADRLGVMFLDENRVFAVGDQFTQNMRDLVSRDRNHPSVMFYSFCNEPGCNNGDKSAPTQPSYDFKAVTYEIDGTRPVTGNMCVQWGSCPTEEQYLTGKDNNMSQILDIQGFSHVPSWFFADYHAVWPNKPLVASECCSCETQRGEDSDLGPYAPTCPLPGKHCISNTSVFYSNFNIDCVKEQTQWSNALDFVGGTFVWTLHDYFGEPDHWPHISSSFGSYDLAGFPKAAVWWYRSWWLANTPMDSPDRPPITETGVFVHIAESWRPNPNPSVRHRVIHVYANTPTVAIAVNGGAKQTAVMPAFGYATFENVTYAEGSIAATAIDAAGAVVASETASSFGEARSLKLTLDAPSVTTGTGRAVYLDGKDVALVRCTVVDAKGNTVHTSSANVTFAVAAGPGMVWGTGSGNPSDHNHNHNPLRASYHGLTRAIVRTTVDAAGGDRARALRKLINLDAGAGLGMASIELDAARASATGGITVEASSPGLGSATLVIPTSTDPADAPLEAARQSIGAGYIGG